MLSLIRLGCGCDCSCTIVVIEGLELRVSRSSPPGFRRGGSVEILLDVWLTQWRHWFILWDLDWVVGMVADR